MLDTFVDGVTAEDGYPHKPDPAMFEALIARHGLARDEVLAVGDRDVDILAGKAAGVRVCLYGPALPGIAADCQVTDYADLLVWLGEEVAVDSPNPKGCIR